MGLLSVQKSVINIFTTKISVWRSPSKNVLIPLKNIYIQIIGTISVVSTYMLWIVPYA